VGNEIGENEIGEYFRENNRGVIKPQKLNPSALTRANVNCSRGRAAKNSKIGRVNFKVRAQLIFSAFFELL
jgi:hypothetical protein